MKEYFGDDLGACYSPEATKFRLWAPEAKKVEIGLFADGEGHDWIGTFPMKKGEGGTWTYTYEGDGKGIYYEYHLTFSDHECTSGDPYAKTAGVNGRKSMVLDLEATNPTGWEGDTYVTLSHPTDAIICEVSVRDQTSDPACGVVNKGKFLGLAEENTHTPSGFPTGLSYLKELGITHIQLMPIYDFGSVDEADTESGQYNWGYDPVNYNLPEGSYSTDPFHGEVRVRELKEMIQAIHKAGMGVIMDVVYNHTFDIEGSVFQKTAPDYFYRKTADGTYSDASACGNEVASEQPMVRKYILDSVTYWAREYHIDGFRFDLMGILDLETMRQVEKEIHAINPNALIYGEGWTGGDSTLDDSERALKKNMKELPGIGAFSDDIRDTIRGHVFTAEDRGFAAGREGLEKQVMFAICGACDHESVGGDFGRCSDDFWALTPDQCINYVSCHDNFTLWDKLSVSNPEATEEEILAMNKLAAHMVFTSQGIPFFLSGEEFGRTKKLPDGKGLSENSFNLPVETNLIDYSRAEEKRDLIQYYKKLIAFRKENSRFFQSGDGKLSDRLHFESVKTGKISFELSAQDEKLEITYEQK